MKIGEKIRMIREIKGISQEALATNLNISPQAYGKIEREETKLDIKRIENIAKHLKVTFEDIIYFDEKNMLKSSFNNQEIGSFNLSESKDGLKIIEKLLNTIEGRFEKQDKIMESNLKIIERFGELIKT